MNCRSWLPFCFVFLPACSSDVSSPLTSTCTAGASQACVCSGGRAGIEVCSAAGTFLPCICGDAGGGESSSATLAGSSTTVATTVATSFGTTTSTTTTGPSFSTTGPASTSSVATSGSGYRIQCSVPAVAPSAGSCVTVGAAGSAITCNPVTNAGCTGGDACDISGGLGQVTGFQCYPPPDSAGLCDACSDESGGPSCIPGATCAVTLTCARYCCTDADCGPGGTCTTGAFTPASSVLGACTAD